MANYFRLDTIKVKAVRTGDIFSVKVGGAVREIPNGILGYLGGYVAGSTEVRDLLDPTAELIGAKLPAIIHVPEVNYDQSTKSKAGLGLFRSSTAKALRAYQLEARDEICVSSDLLKKTGAIAVGDVFVIKPNMVAGTQLEFSASAPSTGAKAYFKVTNVEKSHDMVFLGGDGQAFPQAYDLVDLELVLV